jgi:hypothetical protein
MKCIVAIGTPQEGDTSPVQAFTGKSRDTSQGAAAPVEDRVKAKLRRLAG